MTIADELDRLRTSVRGCELTAYADLSAGLVLTVSAVVRPPQEALDALSRRAGELLDAPAPAEVLAVGSLDEAVDLSPDGTAAFLRSRAEPAEVLCCRGSTGMDVAELLVAARATLRRIDARGPSA